MKKILALMLAISIVVGVPVSTYALTKASENQYVVKQDEVINDDLFVAAESVTIEGIVNGDVYAVGNRVTVRGTVNGDVIAAASLVEVSGIVRDDLRTAGETVTINSSAKIGDSLTAVGGNINVSSDSAIGGGVQVAGSAVDLSGSIGRGILAGAGNLTINGPVVGDIKADVDKLAFGDKADVKGKINYSSSKEANIDEGANLANAPELKKQETDSFAIAFAAKVVGNSYGFAAAFVTGAALILMAKKHVRQIANTINAQKGRTLGFGLLFLLAGIPAIILLAMTFVGLPLALISLALWAIALYVGKLFAAVAVGDMLLRRNNSGEKSYAPNVYGALAIGLAIYYLLTLMPVISFFVSLGATAVGLGGLVIELQRGRQHTTPKATVKK